MTNQSPEEFFNSHNAMCEVDNDATESQEFSDQERKAIMFISHYQQVEILLDDAKQLLSGIAKELLEEGIFKDLVSYREEISMNKLDDLQFYLKDTITLIKDEYDL